MNTLAWHYTVGIYWPKIMADGFLKLTPSLRSLEPGESQLVWFSTNPVYEQTASKGLSDTAGNFQRWGTFEDTREFGGGIVRLAVERRHLRRWRDFRDTQPRGLVKRLERSAKERYADPREWYVYPAECPADLWAGADEWDGHRWVPKPVVLTPGADVLNPLSNLVDLRALTASGRMV